MQKIERLVAITLLLQARGKMTAGRLAAILGVSTRTIYRDITALSLAHVPVSMDYGPGGGYYLPDDYHFESAIFTREEAVSLLVSADISGSYSLFAGDDGLHRALWKLEAALPGEYRTDIQVARERIFFDTTAWHNGSTPTAYLEMIRTAVLNAFQLDILSSCLYCAGTSGLRWRRVEPHGLVFKGLPRRHIRTGIWYLVVFCQMCQGFHSLRVSSIEDLQLCKEQITPQPGFNLQTYWKETQRRLAEQTQPLALILRVIAATRYELKGNFSVLSEGVDGSIIVRLEVDSLEAAVSSTLALGAGATVLSPRRVRQIVAATAQAITEKYTSLNSDTAYQS